MTEIFNDAKMKRDELHKVADIAFHEAALDILMETQEDSKAVLKFLQTADEELVPAVKAIQSEQLKQKEAQERKDLDKEFSDQMKWLRSGTSAELDLPEKFFRDNIDRRHPGTCKWIREDELFRHWLGDLDDQTPDRLLWVMGEAGYGKSVLVSSVVEWLEDQEPEQGKDRPIILKFFCKTGNDATQRGNRIMLHFLLQLLNEAGKEPVKKSKSSDDKAFQSRKKRCVEYIKEARTNSKESMTITFKDFQAKSGMQPLLIALAKALEKRVYVILDALDECNDWSDGLLDALLQIADTNANIRVLISSRPEEEIRDALHGYPFIDVTKVSTAKDVESYISGSLKQIKRFKKDQRSIASTTIATKSDGMFRYANLAVESLKRPKAVMTSFKKLMDEFPDGMAGLYRQELQTLHPDSRHILLVALRWMVCGEGRISAGPIADELEHTFLDEDDLDEEEETASQEVTDQSDDESDDSSSASSGDENESVKETNAGATEERKEDGDEDENKNGQAEIAENNAHDNTSQGGTNISDDEDEGSRESINILKNVSRNFLKFDKEDHISLQHASVRDFILSESKHLDREETLCPRCRERFGSLSTAEASPKHGHLFMAIHCLKTLNCRAFQKTALQQSILKDHLLAQAQSQDEDRDENPDNANEPVANEGEHSESDVATTDPEQKTTEGEQPKNLDTEGFAQNSIAEEGVDAVDHAIEENSPATETNGAGESKTGETVSSGEPVQSEEQPDADHSDTESIQYAPTDAGSVASFQTMSEAATEDESLRYELIRWHYHVREAEKLWPQDERDEEQWANLYAELETFLNEENDAFKIWQRRVLSWRDLKSFDHPIHVAARYGLIHHLQLGLENGIDVNIANENESTPLHLVCIGDGDLIGLELLVEHGAEINGKSKLNSDTALHIFVDSDGPADKLRYLLDKGGDPTIRNDDECTILHLAIRQRNYENVKVILEHPATDVNVRDNYGETPLHWLFAWPNAPHNILRLLLAKGANVNEQDKDSQAPLYEACLSGDVLAARALLKAGADVNDGEDVWGRTALHEAIDSQNLALVQVLLEYKADVTVKDKQLRDAISMAAYKDNANILKAVLDALKNQDIGSHILTELDVEGHSPLHRSAARGRKDIVELLLKAGDGAKLAAQLNRNGNTALHSAAHRGHLEVMELLVAYGGDPLARDSNGNSPLDIVLSHWRKAGLLNGEAFQKLATFLAEKGPTEAQEAASDLFDIAIENGAIAICRVLTGSGGKLASKKDKHGWTPLMLAIQSRQHPIIQLLAPFDDNQLLDSFSTKQQVSFGERPSAWSTDDLNKFAHLGVSEDGLEATRINYYVWDRGMVLADHPIPFGTTRYYYEITVHESENVEGIIGLGFTNQYTLLDNMPGWDTCRAPSWGYHGDDGGLFHYQHDSFHVTEGPHWTKGDTIGCGIDFIKGTIFYTKNGELLGDAFNDVGHGRLFPCVGIGPERITVRANFGLDGETPFKYDVHRYDEDSQSNNKFKRVSDQP